MAETQPASLYSVCHAIALEHGLDESKVLATAAKQVPVSHNAPPITSGLGLQNSQKLGGSSHNLSGKNRALSPIGGLRRERDVANSSFVSLSEVVDMPKGKTLNDMNVTELKELL
jgi:hypothetical protein